MNNKLVVFASVALFALILSPKLVSMPQDPKPSVLGVETESETNTSIKTAPELAANINPPEFTAKSILAADLNSGTVLYAKNLDQQLPIASLTKLMTALVVAERASLEDAVVVQPHDLKVIGSTAGLLAYEKLTVRQLLTAMLVASSNDAAQSLARHAGTDPQTFVDLMNRKAAQLDLNDTKFSNPVGFDSSENYSTAVDLLRLVTEYIKNPVLSEISALKQAEVQSMDGKFRHAIKTTNKLLISREYIIGIKTGFTSEAKGNLIVRSNKDDTDVITIVLNSDNRESDTEKLLDWIYSSYRW